MKKIFSVVFSLFLVACAPKSTPVSPTSTPTRIASQIIPVSGIDASSTPSPVPSKTKTSTASPKTPTLVETSISCLHLVHPSNGAILSDIGKVEFAWESQNDAQLYVLSLISQEGVRDDIQSTSTSLTHSIKGGAKSVIYYWSVSAYDAKGFLICNSGFIQFSREISETDKATQVVASSLLVPPPIVPDAPIPVYVITAPPAPTPIFLYVISPTVTAVPSSTNIPTLAPPATSPPTDPPPTDPPPTDPPPTDPLPTDPPPTNPPPTDPPPTDPPPTNPPSTDPPLY